MMTWQWLSSTLTAVSFVCPLSAALLVVPIAGRAL
jgi:hypothetical protein